MNDDTETPAPSDTNRRAFLRQTGLGIAGASIATMLGARQAPAQIRVTSLRILQWSHFVPAYDVWFDKFAQEWGDKNGVRVRIDRIPHLELPSRLAAEFAAGGGHDLIYFVGTILTGLYYRNLVDVGDIAERIGTRWGGWLPAAIPVAVVEGRWHAVPDFYILAPLLWRKDLFDQNNLQPPDTWELARVAGRTLKAKGHPTGLAFSHCNDANLFLRSILFGHGAQEADPSGQQILLDSRETRAGREGVPHPSCRQLEGRHGRQPRVQHAVPAGRLPEADARDRHRPQAAGPPGFPQHRRVRRLPRAVHARDPGGRRDVRAPGHVHAGGPGPEPGRRREVGDGGVPADLRQVQAGLRAHAPSTIAAVRPCTYPRAKSAQAVATGMAARFTPATATSSSRLTSITPSPAATVCRVGSSRKIDANMKSLPTVPTVKSAAATSTFRLIGSTILRKAVAGGAPSTSADSSISRGR